MQGKRDSEMNRSVGEAAMFLVRSTGQGAPGALGGCSARVSRLSVSVADLIACVVERATSPQSIVEGSAHPIGRTLGVETRNLRVGSLIGLAKGHVRKVPFQPRAAATDEREGKFQETASLRRRPGTGKLDSESDGGG